MNDAVERLQPDHKAAVQAAVARDVPSRLVGSIRVCQATPAEIILRVYLPVKCLKPTPYAIYRIDLSSLVATQLTGPVAKPFEIANYK
jgi:hypothetical protein